jgi:hypothetical protein
MTLSKDSPDGYFKSTTISMFKIETVTREWERRKSIRKTLGQIPTQFVGRNFLAIVTTKIMEDLIEISKDMGLVDPFSKWLYVVSDSSSTSNNMTVMSAMISEGNNIALVYNMTKATSSCSVSLLRLKVGIIVSLVPCTDRSEMPRLRYHARLCSGPVANDSRREGCLWSNLRRRVGGDSTDQTGAMRRNTGFAEGVLAGALKVRHLLEVAGGFWRNLGERLHQEFVRSE